ncbi:hypothetical protein [Anabaena catenula]|nr:hypothetical protein [Anabaena catenula]
MSNLLATHFIFGYLQNVRLLIKSSDAYGVRSYRILKIAARNGFG